MINKNILDNNLFSIFIFFTSVQFITTMLVGDIFGSDRAHIFIYEQVGSIKKCCAESTLFFHFSSESVAYRPLSNFVEGYFSNIYKFHAYNYHGLIVLFNAILGGILACLIFNITQFFSKSYVVGFLACVLGCWSLANIVSSWYILFSFWQIIILLINAILILSYLNCIKDNNRWFYFFLFFGIVGPWFREACLFSITAIFFHQLISFPSKRNVKLLISSLLITLHAIYPTFIPNFLGIYQHEIKSVFSASQVAEVFSEKWINHNRAGRFIRQFPLTIWLITLLPIIIYLNFYLQNRFKIKLIYLDFISGYNFNNLHKIRFDSILILIIFLITSFYVISFSQLFLYSRFPNVELLKYETLFSGHSLLLLLLIFFCGVSCFRFGCLLPLWTSSGLPSLVTFFENNESHMGFTTFPLAILLALWISDIFKYIESEFILNKKNIILKRSVILFFLIGMLDHFSTVTNSYFSNAKLKRDIINISDKLIDFVGRDDVVFVNNIVSFEIFDRSVDLKMGKRISGGGSLPILPNHKVYDLEKQKRKIREVFDKNSKVFYFLNISKNHEGHYQIPEGTYKILSRHSIEYRYFSLDPFNYFFEKPAYMKFIGPSRWHVIFDKTHSFSSRSKNKTQFLLMELKKS